MRTYYAVTMEGSNDPECESAQACVYSDQLLAESYAAEEGFDVLEVNIVPKDKLDALVEAVREVVAADKERCWGLTGSSGWRPEILHLESALDAFAPDTGPDNGADPGAQPAAEGEAGK